MRLRQVRSEQRAQVVAEGGGHVVGRGVDEGVTLGYDSNGNVKTRTDAGGRTTTTTYNARDQASYTIAPDGGYTCYGYGSDGRLNSITDPINLYTTYGRNGFGDLTTLTSPTTGTTAYARDDFGRTTSETRANGRVITYSWDALDRLRSRTSQSLVESYHYLISDLPQPREWTKQAQGL